MSDHDAFTSKLRRDLRVAFDPRTPLRLADTPDFPLAFNVALPAEAPSSNGAVLFRFRQLALEGAAAVRVDLDRSGGRAVAVVEWSDLVLEGRYDLLAKPMPVVAMDTGGTMFDRAPPDALPAGAPPLTPLDPAQQSAMLDQAREERTRLMDHPHGAQLLAAYNEHNEVYNTVFAISAAARHAWAAEGATKEMAIHTHDALQPANRGTAPINPPASQATFGPHNVSYNANAFNQQVQIAVNTAAADPDFDIFSPTATVNPDSKYTKAAVAALTFGNAVGQTGNSKASVNPLSGEAVHAAVKTGRQPKPATVGELQNIVAQGAKPGGAATAVARERGWRVLDEADRTLVRRSLQAMAVERAERSTVVAAPLWTGTCGAEVSGASVRLAVGLDGRVMDPPSVELPAFELELDDAAWTGEAGDVARRRLADAFFISSLLRERIVDALSARARAACVGIPAGPSASGPPTPGDGEAREEGAFPALGTLGGGAA